jgi:hypothetical protein
MHLRKKKKLQNPGLRDKKGKGVNGECIDMSIPLLHEILAKRQKGKKRKRGNKIRYPLFLFSFYLLSPVFPRLQRGQKNENEILS